jgi:cell division protein FtsW
MVDVQVRTAPAAPSRPRPGPRPPAGRRDRVWVAIPAVVGVLCGIGLMMVLSASSVQALRTTGGPWVFFVRQAAWVAAGAAALWVSARVDYHRWRSVARLLLGTCVVLLVCVLVPALGITAGGSSRWLGFGQFRFQPSELAKLGLLLFAADLLARRTERRPGNAVLVRPVLLVTCLVGLLVLLQPDMGTAMILVVVVLAVLFVGGVRLTHMAALLAGTVASAVVLGLAEGYRRARLFAFMDPWKDPSNTGYQIAQSLVALGTGHLSGVGLGASRAKWGFLPNAHTDFIFAIIGEELGLLGTILVVALFGVFTAAGIRAASRAPDCFGRLVAAGVTVWVVGQAFINVGAVIGILPVTGVPLPFVSFGGSSLVITMAAVGILVNVARQGERSR